MEREIDINLRDRRLGHIIPVHSATPIKLGATGCPHIAPNINGGRALRPAECYIVARHSPSAGRHSRHGDIAAGQTTGVRLAWLPIT